MTYQLYWSKPFQLHYSKVLDCDFGAGPDVCILSHTLIIGPLQIRWYGDAK